MRVSINALQYKTNSSGIGILIRELFGRLGEALPCRVVLCKAGPSFPKGKKAELVYAPCTYAQGLYRVLYQSFILGYKHCKDSVLLTTDSKIPLIMPRSTRLVPVITDLAVFRMSEVYQGSRALLWKYQYRHLCRRADRFIAISEFTKRELIDVLGIPAEKIGVVYCAAPENMGRVEDRAALEACREKYGLPRQFVLFVGNFNPRKNLERLIRAFDQMKKSTDLPHALVIAGEQGWKFDRTSAMTGISSGDQVRLIGYVPDEDMAALYSLAEAFVYPSLYEGFGIPVVEAQRCGTPVLASNTGSMPEVGGAGARYVDPYREDDIARGMQEILTDTALRERLIREGYKNARRFSWRESANELQKNIRGFLT